MKTQNLIGQATAEQIAKWKEQYKAGIYSITAGDHIAYFRNPQRQDVAKAMELASDEDQLSGIEEFGKLCCIGGSEDILKDDSLFLSARHVLSAKVQGSEIKAQLVNL